MGRSGCIHLVLVAVQGHGMLMHCEGTRVQFIMLGHEFGVAIVGRPQDLRHAEGSSVGLLGQVLRRLHVHGRVQLVVHHGDVIGHGGRVGSVHHGVMLGHLIELLASQGRKGKTRVGGRSLHSCSEVTIKASSTRQKDQKIRAGGVAEGKRGQKNASAKTKEHKRRKNFVVEQDKTKAGGSYSTSEALGHQESVFNVVLRYTEMKEARKRNAKLHTRPFDTTNKHTRPKQRRKRELDRLSRHRLT